MTDEPAGPPTRVDQALWAIMRELRSLRSELVRLDDGQRQIAAQMVRMMQRPAERELLSAHAIDKAFRLGNGTARKACDAGLIPCAAREKSGRRAYLISYQDAWAMWGPR